MATATIPEKGFFWHVHHDLLVEWCYGYTERVKYINTDKPPAERELRLSLFAPVQGALPDAFIQACSVYDQACSVFVQARSVYDQALAEHMPALVGLHRIECPDCPWDGYTIFSAEATARR